MKQKPPVSPDSRNTHAWTGAGLSRLLDTLQQGVFVINRDNRITFFNRAAEKITGTSRKHAMGRICREVLRAECCGDGCPLRKTLATGKPSSERRVSMVTAQGLKKDVVISTAALRDPQGNISEAVETIHDISGEIILPQSRVLTSRQHAIITINPELQKIINTLPMIAESDSTVLLQGESGTGKNLVAAAIHHLSQRSGKPFVAVNCGALPDTLLESELFGYKKGAFTDARTDKPGRFAMAEGGVLFLDEIGDTSAAMQVKLLRAIQEKVYEPLGGTESIFADVRIIAASNKRLHEMVKAGDFRADLYYRLNIITITLPPLRSRREDVPLLADYFIDRLNKLQNKHVRGIDEKAMACLMAYDFPGNIRELENIIERSFVMCRKGYIGTHHLPRPLSEAVPAPVPDMPDRSMRAMEAAFISNVLANNNWDRQKSAKQLGIHRSSLYRKMRLLGIRAPTLKNRKADRRSTE